MLMVPIGSCYKCVNCGNRPSLLPKTLSRFVDGLKGSKDQKAVKSALEAWFHEALHADWKSPADVLNAYANASIVGPDRVVFNIKGNDYQLVMAIKPIRGEADYERGLRRVEELWNSPEGSAESD